MTITRHGCYNRKPFLETLLVQNGWTTDGRRVMKNIPFNMSSNCEYQKEHDDPRCCGCVWNAKNNEK